MICRYQSDSIQLISIKSIKTKSEDITLNDEKVLTLAECFDGWSLLSAVVAIKI